MKHVYLPTSGWAAALSATDPKVTGSKRGVGIVGDKNKLSLIKFLEY